MRHLEGHADLGRQDDHHHDRARPRPRRDARRRHDGHPGDRADDDRRRDALRAACTRSRPTTCAPTRRRASGWTSRRRRRRRRARTSPIFKGGLGMLQQRGAAPAQGRDPLLGLRRRRQRRRGPCALPGSPGGRGRVRLGGQRPALRLARGEPRQRQPGGHHDLHDLRHQEDGVHDRGHLARLRRPLDRRRRGRSG
jgi:hypothetical protein